MMVGNKAVVAGASAVSETEERKLRWLVVNTLIHLRGHTVGCLSDCECLACVGDSFNRNGFSDREAGKRWHY